MPLPHRIKYAVSPAIAVTAGNVSVSAALVTDGTSGSATPSGLIRLGTLQGTITGGGSLTALANVLVIYLASDSLGRNPITETSTTTKLGSEVTAALGGFAVRLEQDVYVSGSVYAVVKLAAGDSGDVVFTLTFREAV